MRWAEQCKLWMENKDVFVYFDNDEQGFAAFNAKKLQEQVNVILSNKLESAADSS